MKHLKSFENFEVIDEGFDLGNVGKGVSKFFTGHEGSKEKDSSRAKILSTLDNKIEKLVEKGWLDADKVESKKAALVKQAERNGWRGKIVLRKSPRTGNMFIVYDDGNTGLQNLGSAATSSVKGNL